MSNVESFDLVVIGGGINGTGIARDAAGRGLSVLLCEADDLGSHTSSASTKLIHGGLRYLEQYEFKLVSKALAEREVLLKAAPHIIWPMRFVLPHQRHLRPAWMIRMGLFLYDHLGGGKRTLEGSKGIKFANHPAGSPLRDDFTSGFVYSDAWVQDARLVVLNAMDAVQRGARVLTRTRCESASRSADGWHVRMKTADGETIEVKARGLANAAGPWAVNFLDDVAHMDHGHALRLIKGSHIVVPKIFDHDFAYIFQQPDRRIVFAIPYEQDFTLVGTTDVEYQGNPGRTAIDEDEIAYLCSAANRYFKQEITPADIVWSYSGVRPLLDDREDNASEITRDYRLELDDKAAPLLNVFGGKLTTFRRLAEDAVDQLAPLLGNRTPAWTAGGHPLPGGEHTNPEQLATELKHSRPWLPDRMANRLVFNYGTRVEQILGNAKALSDLGQDFGAGLYQAEVDYLRKAEWARCAEDIIWRRSKLGLRLDAAAVARLDDYLKQQSNAQQSSMAS